MISQWEALLDEIDEFLQQREDVRDGSDGMPLPNKAMMLLTDLRHLRPLQPGGERSEGYANGYATAIETAAQVCDEAAANLGENGQPGCAAHTRIVAEDIRELLTSPTPQNGITK